MLLINPDAEYLLFDLNSHKYTEPAINYIKTAFPKTKINIVYGNSVETINQFILDNPNEKKSYELIHLDGGHTEDIFIHDYNNCKELINENGIVIFDDYDLEQIKSFIHRMIDLNEIIEYNVEEIIKNEFHFIYKYIK